jgi:hypothetical protein
MRVAAAVAFLTTALLCAATAEARDPRAASVFAEANACSASEDGLSVALADNEYFSGVVLIASSGATYNVSVSPCSTRNFTSWCNDAYIYVDAGADFQMCFGNASGVMRYNFTTSTSQRTFDLTNYSAPHGEAPETEVVVSVYCDDDAKGLQPKDATVAGRRLILTYASSDACTTKGPDAPPADDENGHNQVAAGIAIGVVGALFLAIGVVIFMFRRAAMSNPSTYEPI